MFEIAALVHYYVVVLPTTLYNAPAPLALVDGLRAEIKTAFGVAFGGYTETVAIGGYVAESGELIEERVYLIEAAYSEPDDELVERLALQIKADLKQESVMIRKDREVYFL